MNGIKGIGGFVLWWRILGDFHFNHLDCSDTKHTPGQVKQVGRPGDAPLPPDR